jgi:hypothetical protein
MHSILDVITDVGDSASLTGIVGACSIYLFSRKSGRGAAFLIGAFLMTAMLIALFKIGFMGCRSHHLLGIRSPSGHTACSTAVFLACAMLMRSQLPENRRFLPLILLTLLILGIAVSRVWLEYHSVAEVVLGLLTGILGIGLARFLVLRSHAVGAFDAYAFALWGVVAGIIMHGTHLPVEEFLHTFAYHLRGHIPFCGANG